MSQGESRLSREIMSALRARGAFVFKVHGGPLMMAGLPDIIGCYKGKYFGFETKVLVSDEPTPIQLRRHEQIREAGGVALVVTCVNDAVNALRAL
jgi:Holliday junction resolvase